MGQRIHITANFGDNSQGQVVTDRGATVQVGLDDASFRPYELLLGGLSYCLKLTLLSIKEKMQLSYSSLEMEIEGIKRDDKVAMLEFCNVSVKVKDVSDQKKFEKAFEISSRYCSTYQTLSKVATMSYTIEYL